MDGKLADVRAQKLSKLQTQKARVRNYSLQVG